jgi:hypothetical protein
MLARGGSGGGGDAPYLPYGGLGVFGGTGGGEEAYCERPEERLAGNVSKDEGPLFGGGERGDASGIIQ